MIQLFISPRTLQSFAIEGHLCCYREAYHLKQGVLKPDSLPGAALQSPVVLKG
jgi:hypothetical protein